MSAPTVTLTATVDTGGSRNLHYLTLDGLEVSRRGSSTRRYTHVLAVHTDRLGWRAWSWHLTEDAARSAARAMRGGRPTRVVEIREVAQ